MSEWAADAGTQPRLMVYGVIDRQRAGLIPVAAGRRCLRKGRMRAMDADRPVDPTSPLRWTCKSRAKLAAALTAQGWRVSSTSAWGGCFHRLGYRLQSVQQTAGGNRAPGPDGVYDMARNEAWVSVGRDHEATALYITADAGGSRRAPPPRRPNCRAATARPGADSRAAPPASGRPRGRPASPWRTDRGPRDAQLHEARPGGRGLRRQGPRGARSEDFIRDESSHREETERILRDWPP